MNVQGLSIWPELDDLGDCDGSLWDLKQDGYQTKGTGLRANRDARSRVDEQQYRSDSSHASLATLIRGHPILSTQ